MPSSVSISSYLRRTSTPARSLRMGALLTQVAEHAEEWLHIVEGARTVVDTIALRAEKTGERTLVR